jgi:hypothetical protein
MDAINCWDGIERITPRTAELAEILATYRTMQNGVGLHTQSYPAPDLQV